MRLFALSIFGRLLAIATLTTIAALAFAAIGIGHVLERFAIRGLDQQLDAEVATLARAIRPDGTLDRARVVNLPAFDAAADGWSWRVESSRGTWTGGDLAEFAATPRPPPPWGAKDHGRDRDLPRPGDAAGEAGEPIHFRQLSLASAAGPVIVTAAGPRRVAIAPLRDAMAPLLLSLGLLGTALALATALQLRFGLRPLHQLRRDVGEVRAGRMSHVPANQPAEVAPLAVELNALIDQNEAQLIHARRHVANLAHGLKTPLAALSVRLAESGRDPDGSLGDMVAQIEGRVRHHLGRARAAAPGGRRYASTPLAPAVADLVSALARIHADRAIRPVIELPPDLAAAVDDQDLDEMIGNLLDNAWRHARGEVRVDVHVVASAVTIAIADDGPGLSDAATHEALVPGRSLDERGSGHGFGLSIAADLAELNGGGLALGRSEAGGLRAMLTLPLAGGRAAPT